MRAQMNFKTAEVHQGSGEVLSDFDFVSKVKLGSILLVRLTQRQRSYYAELPEWSDF